MQSLDSFESGKPISAEKLNSLVEAVNVLQNVIAGDGIEVDNTATGLIISAVREMLTIDDRYKLDTKYNQSDRVQRKADQKQGDIADQFRIRSTTEADPSGRESVLYRLMWLINRLDTGGEGGWITDAGRSGLSKTKADFKSSVPTPAGRIGQLGDVIELDEDDEIAQTADGDIQCYANIRHDAHFKKDTEHDGRLYLVDANPGHAPYGPHLMGDFVGDPSVANTDSRLNKETVNWRPSFTLPIYGCELLIFPGDYQQKALEFPEFADCPYSRTRAALFPNDG